MDNLVILRQEDSHANSSNSCFSFLCGSSKNTPAHKELRSLLKRSIEKQKEVYCSLGKQMHACEAYTDKVTVPLSLKNVESMSKKKLARKIRKVFRDIAKVTQMSAAYGKLAACTKGRPRALSECEKPESKIPPSRRLSEIYEKNEVKRSNRQAAQLKELERLLKVYKAAVGPYVNSMALDQHFDKETTAEVRRVAEHAYQESEAMFAQNAAKMSGAELNHEIYKIETEIERMVTTYGQVQACQPQEPEVSRPFFGSQVSGSIKSFKSVSSVVKRGPGVPLTKATVFSFIDPETGEQVESIVEYPFPMA